MEQLEALDEQLFWWVNSHHAPWLDWLLWGFSQSWSWMLVMLLVLLMVIVRDRKSWLWVVIGMALCFLLADQISSNVIKDGVMRLRPCHALDDVRMFHTSKGGLYGFVSSHAANAFALAMYIALSYGGKNKHLGEQTDNQSKGTKSLKEKRTLKGIKTLIRNTSNGWRSPLLPYILMLWAAIVAYSRPYLGKHYPGDVICGALLGLGIGALVYFLTTKLRQTLCKKQKCYAEGCEYS